MIGVDRMITPKQLKRKTLENGIKDDLSNALMEFEKEVLQAVNNGKIKIVVPAPTIGKIFYHDEKQDAFAEELIKLGFKCKKESINCGGVIQSPSWYVYFI